MAQTGSQADTLHFELVSPERLLMEADTDSVVVPGAEGDFQVLPNHAPMLSTIRPGVIEVQESGKSDATRLFIRAGFAEVGPGGLVVLAEECVPVAELSKADLEQRIQNTKEDLEDATTDEARRHAEEELVHLNQLLSAAS